GHPGRGRHHAARGAGRRRAVGRGGSGGTRDRPLLDQTDRRAHPDRSGGGDGGDRHRRGSPPGRWDRRRGARSVRRQRLAAADRHACSTRDADVGDTGRAARPGRHRPYPDRRDRAHADSRTLDTRVSVEVAFGAPGIGPTWTSSAKDLVTTALGPSRLWATVGFGILNEVYWPATGLPQIRDLGFIVAGAEGWFEVKRVNHYEVSTPAPHVPLPCAVHEGEGYRLTLEFLPAPLRDALLVCYRLEGDGLRLYPLLAPHLGGSGHGNSAWIGDGLYAG